jgi:hypothetical protein
VSNPSYRRTPILFCRGFATLVAGAVIIFTLYLKDYIAFRINALRYDFKRLYIQWKGDLTHYFRDILI